MSKSTIEARRKPISVSTLDDVGAAMSLALTSDAPLKDALALCVRSVVKECDVRAVAVWTLDTGKEALELAAWAGLQPADPGEGQTLAIGEGAVGETARTRRGTAHTESCIGSTLWPGEKGCHLSLPLVVGNELVGVLEILDRSVRPRAEGEALRTLCYVIALGIAMKRTGDALARSEQRFRILFDCAPDYVLVVDPARPEGPTIVDANAAACSRHGYTRDELVGMPMTFLDSDRDKELIPQRAAQIMSGVRQTFEATHVCKDGSEFPVEVTAQLVDIGGHPHVYAIERDLTDRKRLEAELLHAQKIETLGLLAGGLAHDFNNFLTVILGGVSVARHDPASADTAAVLTDVERACKRARGLTRQLLTFTSAGDPILKPVEIGTLVEETIGFSFAGAAAAAELSVQGDVPNVDGDEGQLTQAFSNLMINAIQAMPEGGVIRVSVDRAEAPVPRGSAASQWVLISIHDEGTGIDTEDLPRIFDPYFSTKSGGRGLGLASTHSIVQRHNGYVHVSSQPGKGTTFQVYLPASSAAVAWTRPAVSVGKGGGRILVMDDDAAVRSVTARMLRSLGYEAESVPEGKSAIARYDEARREGRPFAAVIVDLTIRGGMGGRETIKALLELDPGTKAIVCSGYSEDSVLANHREHGFMDAIAKPFHLGELGATLDRLIHGGVEREA